ncbi:hypothetical protein O181_031516 [Austropuccinia psidii MF-1]|uniref:Uncharacterized protein n=1 Tax=Austropuccinia psidii MF-1 TaxID=1389203 RepID=A0A9Q3H597_9BASI|nr:hypothetical protein [Austropuccinia psidii MF-1]
MSDSIINMEILRKCGGELEHAIKGRCVEPCSTEDYINAMEDNIPRTRIVLSLSKDNNKEKFASNEVSEAQIHPDLLSKIKQELTNVLYIYKNSFASENEYLGAIKEHEVDITLNIDRPYPPVLRRPAYPGIPRTREALEKHIQELTQIIILIKPGHSEEVEATTPVVIAWHNDKLRMVSDFTELNT